jgi:1,4-dihydroxy-6-naphthoate synthase
VFADVAELNKQTFQRLLSVSKISIHAFALSPGYVLLRSGGAVGHNCGPLLLKRSQDQLTLGDVASSQILIPGESTTAALYLRLAFAHTGSRQEMLFSQIMPALARGEGDMGLIIHESRFTYPRFGLESLLDLGEWWEGETGLPIPLGGIAAQKELGASFVQELEEAISESIRYAQAHEEETLAFCREYAQELEEEVMRRHIRLYVNDYSLSMSGAGEKAVTELFERGHARGIMEKRPDQVFV